MALAHRCQRYVPEARDEGRVVLVAFDAMDFDSLASSHCTYYLAT
jgi:hypothetical protein